ncbi:MAG: hypothetical protein IZT55_01505 [Anaerolineae bacterium]|nr:hypothetical protein [Anaerolineae bacterium]
MLFLQSTPDTTAFMVAGYVMIFGVMAIYIVSFFVRTRNLKRDLEILNEVDDQ